MPACTQRLKMMKNYLSFINKFLDVNNPMYAYKTHFIYLCLYESKIGICIDS